MIIAWRDWPEWLNFVILVMVELSSGKGGISRDEENLHEKLGYGEFRVQDNKPSPIRLIQVPIRRITTPIRGLQNTIWQVLLVISHRRSDYPYRSHLHPPSLSSSSTTPTSSQEHKVKSSFSISPCHQHEITLGAAYTEYSIHQTLSVVPWF